MRSSKHDEAEEKRTCTECGTSNLLTQVRLTLRAAGGTQPNASERNVILCPACLSESLNAWRRDGGIVEARLDSGRIVRW